MGCSASKHTTILNTRNPENPSISPSETSNSSSSPPNPTPKAFSLSTPLVHHPPLRKGDTHHLVSLTSTTYGSLLLLDPPKTPPFQPPKPEPKPQPEPALSPDSVINTWELMDGLEDDFDHLLLSSTHHRRPINSCRFASRLNSFDSVRHTDDFFYSSSSSFSSSSSSATKPLWQHLSEESLLSKMDPNVGSTYRRALSSRQLGLDNRKHSKTRSLGSSPFGASSSQWRKSSGKEDKIIIYFTSLRGIRKTYEDCCSVRMIFRAFRVPVDERDLSMDSEFRKELEAALGGKVVGLPRVFIKGRYVGGAEEIERLHEVGELAALLEGFPVMESGFVCNGCGDARFVPCRRCNGSRKVFEEEEGGLRRCLDCNENGLIRCPGCCS